MTHFNVGPFQEIVGISFPGDSFGDFIHNEDALGRTNNCDESTEYDLTTQVVVTDPNNSSCDCPNSIYSGQHTGRFIRISVPLTASWPDCVIGGTSGAKISGSWPDEPAGWGGGSPAPFDNWGTCGDPQWSRGNVFLSTYRVEFHILQSCTPPLQDPDCCGS